MKDKIVLFLSYLSFPKINILICKVSQISYIYKFLNNFETGLTTNLT